MTTAPRDEWVTVNGLRLHYRDWGGAGQPVLLLHGLASTCHIWDLVASILARDFRVVSLDQRGHGESDKPSSGYDFATVCADAEGLVRELALQRPIVVGHSWGGSVALELAVRYPAVPAGLVFVDGGMIDIASRPGMTLEQAKTELAPPVWTGMTLEQLRQRIRARDIGVEVTPEIGRIVLACFTVLPDGTVASRLSREDHMKIIESLWTHHPAELYPRVRCPVLLMPARRQGDESARRWRREDAVATAESMLPVSKTVWMEDSIHDVPIQRPELVAQTIREHVLCGFFERA